LFFLSAAIVILPWTWHNWQVTGQIISIQTGGGYNFFLGNGFVRHWLNAPFSYAGLKTYTA
jgi:hypothetical protein